MTGEQESPAFLARRLAGLAVGDFYPLAAAESCTGGLASAWLTSVSGASGWFGFGVVSYSNAAKTDLLGVPPELLARFGAVSEEVAEAMCAGLLARGAGWRVFHHGDRGSGRRRRGKTGGDGVFWLGGERI